MQTSLWTRFRLKVLDLSPVENSLVFGLGDIENSGMSSKRHRKNHYHKENHPNYAVN